MTCKKKRLKCDEAKPTCVQCEKRNVECEGYKKDYKWRTFEETTRNSRAAKARKAGNPTSDFTLEAQGQPQSLSGSPTSPQTKQAGWLPNLQDAFTSATQAFTGPSPSPQTLAITSPSRRCSPSQFDPLPILNPGFSPSDFDLPSPFHHSNLQPQVQHHGADSAGQSSLSSGSPNLADLLLPGTDMQQPPDPSELRPPMSPLPYQPGLAESPSPGKGLDDHEEDFDEEITRAPMVAPMMNGSEPQWSFRASSPAESDASTTSSKSTAMSILRPPHLDPASPEMLLLRFDKQTCGILSVKDGPTENPWRTLIWPLAKTSHALYHAISSMAALHGSLSDPKLRLSGMAHMTRSLKELSGGLTQMSFEQALATSLALALGEGWDEKISTGIQHLKGAKALMRSALEERSRKLQIGHFADEDARRIRFLCNTYVYLDVIARLTSSEEQENMDFDNILMAVNAPFSNGYVEIDPLMGCATTLFPIIGRIASLIQRARKMPASSLHVVSEGDELREQLLNWQPPNTNLVEQPEDPSSNARHAVQTALSYRLAALLYLHQAVPELPIESSYKIAKDILTILAGVPLHSRTMIVQIFPLLVGSCEMVSFEDRQWVTQRWEAMMQRLSIVNVKSCWKLVQEVWRRRDAHIEEQARLLTSRSMLPNLSPGLPIPPRLKRKMVSAETFDEFSFFDQRGHEPGLVHRGEERPLKRRLTFDTSTGYPTSDFSHMHIGPMMRRHKDVEISSIQPEYTIHGHLHWLGVMTDWQWEGESSSFLTLMSMLRKGDQLTVYFA